MNWFKNLNVAAKLGIAFGSILLLTTILGVFAIKEIGQVNASAVELGTNWMPSTNKLAEMDKQLQSFRRGEIQHVFPPARWRWINTKNAWKRPWSFSIRPMPSTSR